MPEQDATLDPRSHQIEDDAQDGERKNPREGLRHIQVVVGDVDHAAQASVAAEPLGDDGAPALRDAAVAGALPDPARPAGRRGRSERPAAAGPTVTMS